MQLPLRQGDGRAGVRSPKRTHGFAIGPFLNQQRITRMKHEYRLAEHRDTALADTASTKRGSDADTSFGDLGDPHRDPGRETAWDNWKSVRDVGDAT